MFNRFAFITLLSWLLGGCSYPVKPVSAPAVNIYSSYEEKIQGTWIIVVDDSVNNISREVTPSSHVCSAHTYPIHIGDAFSTSIAKTMQSVFERTLDRATVPSAEELNKMEAKGSILVRVESYEPRVRCSMGGWSGHCSGSADFELGVIARTEKGKVFATSVGDSATVDGDSGGACEKAADVLSEATSKSLKETLEKLAERLINAEKLRNATVIETSTSIHPTGDALADKRATKSQSANYYATSKCGTLKGNITFLGITDGEERYSATCSAGGLLVIGCSDQGCKSL